MTRLYSIAAPCRVAQGVVVEDNEAVDVESIHPTVCSRTLVAHSCEGYVSRIYCGVK